MQARTIIKIVLVIVLIVIAGQPLGQMIVAIGNFLVSAGTEIAKIGVQVHGG
jgi:redox-sensitive bicupin YhaK (pirin superfamily)